MTVKKENMWAIRYNKAKYRRAWIHRDTIRGTRSEAIAAIMDVLSFWSSSWGTVKRAYNLSAVKIIVSERNIE
jgi:hypothetical protein